MRKTLSRLCINEIHSGRICFQFNQIPSRDNLDNENTIKFQFYTNLWIKSHSDQMKHNKLPFNTTYPMS